jgi:hypothetical protein
MNNYFNIRLFALGLVIITTLSYGLFSTNLGFYWDDWPSLWALSRLPFSEFVEFAAYDRPVMVFIQYFLFLVLGTKPFLWHFLIIVLYLFCATMIFLIGNRLSPKRINESAAVTVLVLCYPGFLAHSFSLTYAPYILQLLLILRLVQQSQPGGSQKVMPYYG